MPVATDLFLTPWNILTATAGLVAFHIGLYTLIGRERKSPYVINRAFPVFLICLLVAAIAVVAVLMPAEYRTLALTFSIAGLAIAFLYSFFVVYRVAVRFIFFVDSMNVKHLPYIRNIRRLWHRIRQKKRYAHNVMPMPNDLKAKLIEIIKQFGPLSGYEGERSEIRALAVAVQRQGQANQMLAELSLAFFESGFTVQYLTASRRPIEFVTYLQAFLTKDREIKPTQWEEYIRNLVVIDAYSPHFAFTDSIYPEKDRELQGLFVTRVVSTMTYAGMHSAASRAFNLFPKQADHKERRPTLVIYEDAYALADLESPEQYRLFVRHVLPSERLWDGMFTVFWSPHRQSTIGIYCKRIPTCRLICVLITKAVPARTRARSRPKNKTREGHELAKSFSRSHVWFHRV
jgi:hypothetical protein